MIAEWFLYIGGREEGPFSFEELQRDLRLKMNTLVWKDGLDDWTPIEEIPELKEMLKRRKPRPPRPEFEERIRENIPGGDDVITLRGEPPYWIIWALMILLLLLYFWFQ